MALSRGSPRVAVNNHPALRSPDVPRRRARAHRRDRPTDSTVCLTCYDEMNIIDVTALLAAGLAAGAVNAIAGGGSLITFPTLVAVGLGTVPANVTNSVSVFPGYVAAVYGSR